MGQDDTLAELRVLDMAQGVAGAYAAKLFADLGADVIKIEEPSGDPTRRLGPFPQGQPDLETGALWLHLNTNKRGITLDISQPTGRKLFELLVEGAHLIMESFAPGYLDSLGLGFSRLTQIKRRIVLVSITPYGQWGPYAGRKAADLPSLAVGGETSQYIAGLHAFGAAAVAAFAADGSEVPQHVDISVMECLASTLAMDLPYYAYYRQESRQSKSAIRFPRTSPPGPPFRASALPWRAGRAPRLGEHNQEIYCGELGLSLQELAQLRAARVV